MAAILSTTMSPVETKETPDMSKNTAKTTVDGRAEAMFQSLFAGQLEAMARQMATQFNIDADAAVKMATEHAASIDLKQVAKPKRKSGGKPRKPKVPVTAENRCMARVWGDGSGSNQCKCARADGSDYCSRHGKQAAICEIPCQLDDNGKKMGLFCGRIDQFQEGTNLAPFMVDGEIRIEWNSLEHKEAIAAGMENDTIRHRKKKEKKKKKPVAVVEVDEEQLAAMVAQTDDSKEDEKTNEVVNDVDDDSILESGDIGLEMGFSESKISAEEAARRASIAGHQARIEVLEAQSDLSNVAEEDTRPPTPDIFSTTTQITVSGLEEHLGLEKCDTEDDEESLDVEEWEHEGKTYLVCRETLAIYNEEGEEEMYKWGEGPTQDAAIPAEE